jgi:hypothetical protein
MNNISTLNNISILNNINLNFHKLFIECKDGSVFIPPMFNKTSDIDSLIILYQILDIMCNKRLFSNVSNVILYQVLVQIINIKCKEHVEQYWNKNVENFIATFERYLNSIVENIINNSM